MGTGRDAISAVCLRFSQRAGFARSGDAGSVCSMTIRAGALFQTLSLRSRVRMAANGMFLKMVIPRRS